MEEVEGRGRRRRCRSIGHSIFAMQDFVGIVRDVTTTSDVAATSVAATATVIGPTAVGAAVGGRRWRRRGDARRRRRRHRH